MPLQRTIHLLNSQTKDNQQTISDAFIRGTISDAELQRLNENTAFPNNAYGQLAANEPRYNSLEAMQDFANTIGPKLSNKVLFELNERLFQIEIERGQQAFRNSTLAKVFLQYEIKRYGSLNENFFCHAKRHLLPLIQKHWPDKIEANIKEFIRFNFLISLATIHLPANISQALETFNDLNFEDQLKTTIDQIENFTSMPSSSSLNVNNANQISSPSNMINATDYFIAEHRDNLLTVLTEKQKNIMALNQVLASSEKAHDLLKIQDASKSACLETMREKPEVFDHLTINESTKIKLALAALEWKIGLELAEVNQEMEAYKNLEAKFLCNGSINNSVSTLTSSSSFWRTLNYSNIDKLELDRREAIVKEAHNQFTAKAKELEINISKLGKNFYDENPNVILSYHSNKAKLTELQQLQVGLKSLTTGRNIDHALCKLFEKNKSMFSALVWQEIKEIFNFHLPSVENSQARPNYNQR